MFLTRVPRKLQKYSSPADVRLIQFKAHIFFNGCLGYNSLSASSHEQSRTMKISRVGLYFSKLKLIFSFDIDFYTFVNKENDQIAMFMIFTS